MISKKPKKGVKKIIKKENSIKKGSKKPTSVKTPVKFKKNVKKTSKVTVKKKKSVSKKSLVIAMEDHYFWVNNGPVIKDLVELRNTLVDINKEQFLYHVNGTKNDFAVWIEEVLCDKKCADSIKKTKAMSTTIKNIEKALLRYNYHIN